MGKKHCSSGWGHQCSVITSSIPIYGGRRRCFLPFLTQCHVSNIFRGSVGSLCGRGWVSSWECTIRGGWPLDGQGPAWNMEECWTGSGGGRGWRHSDYKVGLGRGASDVHTSVPREVTPPRHTSVPCLLTAAVEWLSLWTHRTDQQAPGGLLASGSTCALVRPTPPRGDSSSLEERQILSPWRFLRGTYVHIRAELDKKALPLEAQLPHLCPVEGVDLRKTLRRGIIWWAENCMISNMGAGLLCSRGSERRAEWLFIRMLPAAEFRVLWLWVIPAPFLDSLFCTNSMIWVSHLSLPPGREEAGQAADKRER